VVAVEVTDLGLEVARTLPHLGHQHRLRVAHVAAASDQQLERRVELRRVGLVEVDHRVDELRVDPVDAVQRQITGPDVALTRTHQIDVAVDGVDLTVVAHGAEGLRPLPRRQGVGGEAGVEHRETRRRTARRGGRGRRRRAGRRPPSPCRSPSGTTTTPRRSGPRPRRRRAARDVGTGRRSARPCGRRPACRRRRSAMRTAPARAPAATSVRSRRSPQGRSARHASRGRSHPPPRRPPPRPGAPSARSASAFLVVARLQEQERDAEVLRVHVRPELGRRTRRTGLAGSG
jgi:hypothetical protein